MTTNTDTTSELERRTRAVLQASLTRIDARTRSRLNQARHAALESAQRRPLAWRGFRLAPVTGGAMAAAALAVAFVLFVQRPHPIPSGAQGAQPSLEVLDLLADEDNLSLMEDYDHSFYEWAAAQGDATGGGDTSEGSAGG
jgi:hypothetical protein